MKKQETQNVRVNVNAFSSVMMRLAPRAGGLSGVWVEF
jgi:hypothetical protein